MDLLIGRDPSGSDVRLPLKMANRHGLIAGATGTGKTVTLQALAHGFSQAGVPVFTADVKGDLAGIAKPLPADSPIRARAEKLGIELGSEACPVVLWDVLGKRGLPLRSTISEMGPVLLGRILGLNDVQEGVLQIAFRMADEEGLLLIDLKDLRALLGYLADHADEIQKRYGNVSKASVGAIQRSLLAIEEAGGESFFGEPAVSLDSLMQVDFSGRGVVSVLDASAIFQRPAIYSTFLLWLLAELFENLPEAGDLSKPKLVFFFDEAHLLFEDASPALRDKIEQVVRLVRSKGVGIYFVTQNPLDLPEEVLGQLGSRVQHALRAFTPKDQKAVRAAAETFRAAPGLDTAQAITELEIGEALVSTLDERGAPTVVERVMVAPPPSRIGALSDEERKEIVQRSPLRAAYEKTADRESAYEMLAKRVEEEPAKSGPKRAPAGSSRQGFVEAFFKSAARSIGTQVGRQIMRGVLGSIMGGKAR